jgi:hypothetical protein
MPSADQEPAPGQSTNSYVRPARFPSERRAAGAYFRVQEAIFTTECALSAFRLQLNRRWHVVVVGTPPPEELEGIIRKILAAGEPTTLPAEVLAILLQRRADQIRLGPWVERHVRPVPPKE